MIQDVVINEFYEEIERAKQPGYVSRYDDFDFEYSDAPRSRPARFDQPHAYPAAEQPHMRDARARPRTMAAGKPHFRRDSAGDGHGTPRTPPPTPATRLAPESFRSDGSRQCFDAHACAMRIRFTCARTAQSSCECESMCVRTFASACN